MRLHLFYRRRRPQGKHGCCNERISRYSLAHFLFVLNQNTNPLFFTNSDTCAVLVRRHGVYVWGDDWKVLLLATVYCLLHSVLVAVQCSYCTNRVFFFVWCAQKAKTMCECYDYLFEIAVKMKQIGLDPAQKPANSIY